MIFADNTVTLYEVLVLKKVEESHRLAHLNKLSKAGNFLKCYRVRKLVQEANGSSGGSNPSRCNSFLACLIAFAFCFSTRATGMSIL